MREREAKEHRRRQATLLCPHMQTDVVPRLAQLFDLVRGTVGGVVVDDQDLGLPDLVGWKSLKDSRDSGVRDREGKERSVKRKEGGMLDWQLARSPDRVASPLF